MIYKILFSLILLLHISSALSSSDFPQEENDQETHSSSTLVSKQSKDPQEKQTSYDYEDLLNRAYRQMGEYLEERLKQSQTSHKS